MLTLPNPTRRNGNLIVVLGRTDPGDNIALPQAARAIQSWAVKLAELFTPPIIAAIGFAVVLGLPLALYALLTRTQRRTTREIRRAVTEQGWRYRVRRWQGSPTAFRIDGQTRSAQPWVMTSGNTSSYNRGWSAQLGLRFPMLGGETDVSILPRAGEGQRLQSATSHIPPKSESRIAAFSQTLASGVRFLEEARELPSGDPSFDAIYQVLALPQIHHPPIDPALAERILKWPANAIAPHSVLAWRDAFAFEFQARLPAPPNWATVSYFLTLAEDVIAQIPAPSKSPAPPKLADRLLGRLLR
jgi:hypothetical protein